MGGSERTSEWENLPSLGNDLAGPLFLGFQVGHLQYSAKTKQMRMQREQTAEATENHQDTAPKKAGFTNWLAKSVMLLDVFSLVKDIIA